MKKIWFLTGSPIPTWIHLFLSLSILYECRRLSASPLLVYYSSFHHQWRKKVHFLVACACCYVIWCDCIYFIKYIFAADYLAVCYRWDTCGQNAETWRRIKKVYASLLSMKYNQLPKQNKKPYSTQESRMISFWSIALGHHYLIFHL